MKKLIYLMTSCYSFIALSLSIEDKERFFYLYNIDDMSIQNIETTPTQPQGPFYPIKYPSDTDVDLTHINDQEEAKGVKIRLQGQVFNINNEPLSNTLVEIWQAAQSGKYNHPYDNNKAPADLNFQYYAKVTTDENGYYGFKTIVPGPYPARENWWRPSHIHFFVTKQGYKSLITQAYFDPKSFNEPIAIINGEPIDSSKMHEYNNKDLILNRLNDLQKQRLIVTYNTVPNIEEKLGIFNIYLEK